MTILQDESSPLDAPKEHVYELDGATVIAQRRDPFGLFYLRQEKGKLPDKYANNSFTSLFEVERATREYQTELKKK